VGENEMSLLTGGEQANIVRGDDLKVRPTEWSQEARSPAKIKQTKRKQT